MTFANLVNQLPLAASATGIMLVSSLAASIPAQAASLDLSTWTIYGDAVVSPNSATITNALVDGTDDDGSILNVSGSDPLDVGTLETSLGLPPGTLGFDAQEGSAIGTLLSSINAGDVFSFSWNFSVLDSFDLGFVTIDDVATPGLDLPVFTLTGTSPFSYTFAAAGNYRIAIGVVDQTDFINSSVLNISNAQLVPIPTPALLPGLIGLGLSVWRKRKEVEG
jgi:hypothetical protein